MGWGVCTYGDDAAAGPGPVPCVCAAVQCSPGGGAVGVAWRGTLGRQGVLWKACLTATRERRALYRYGAGGVRGWLVWLAGRGDAVGLGGQGIGL